MTLSRSTLRERHDIGTMPLGKLSDCPNERSGKQAGRPLFKRNLVLGIFWNDENKLAADFNARRGAPEITGTHTHSPETSIRLPRECDSFVINTRYPNGKIFSRSSKIASEPLLDANGAQVGTQACAPTLTFGARQLLPHTRRAPPPNAP